MLPRPRQRSRGGGDVGQRRVPGARARFDPDRTSRAGRPRGGDHHLRSRRVAREPPDDRCVPRLGVQPDDPLEARRRRGDVSDGDHRRDDGAVRRPGALCGRRSRPRVPATDVGRGDRRLARPGDDRRAALPQPRGPAIRGRRLSGASLCAGSAGGARVRERQSTSRATSGSPSSPCRRPSSTTSPRNVGARACAPWS